MIVHCVCTGTCTSVKKNIYICVFVTTISTVYIVLLSLLSLLWGFLCWRVLTDSVRKSNFSSDSGCPFTTIFAISSLECSCNVPLAHICADDKRSCWLCGSQVGPPPPSLLLRGMLGWTISLGTLCLLTTQQFGHSNHWLIGHCKDFGVINEDYGILVTTTLWITSTPILSNGPDTGTVGLSALPVLCVAHTRYPHHQVIPFLIPAHQ